jgi:hypothetical protein
LQGDVRWHDLRHAYAKSAKENVTAAERNVMAALVAAIKAGRKER